MRKIRSRGRDRDGVRREKRNEERSTPRSTCYAGVKELRSRFISHTAHTFTYTSRKNPMYKGHRERRRDEDNDEIMA